MTNRTEYEKVLNMTEKQKLIYDYVKQFYEANGYHATIRQIAGEFGFKSTNSVANHLNSLVKQGYLEKLYGGKYQPKEGK